MSDSFVSEVKQGRFARLIYIVKLYAVIIIFLVFKVSAASASTSHDEAGIEKLANAIGRAYLNQANKHYSEILKNPGQYAIPDSIRSTTMQAPTSNGTLLAD